MQYPKTNTEKSPVIVSFETRERFKYLWLKYVNGFNLSVHCARCLIGDYSKKIDESVKTCENLPLNESPARYYYLCGVTYPYRWIDNLHLAFKYKEGAQFRYDDGKTIVVIKDAEQIPIVDSGDYSLEQKGYDPNFNTCRNWRFAYQIMHKSNG